MPHPSPGFCRHTQPWVVYKMNVYRVMKMPRPVPVVTDLHLYPQGHSAHVRLASQCPAHIQVVTDKGVVALTLDTSVSYQKSSWKL